MEEKLNSKNIKGKKISFSDPGIVKIIGAIAVFIPLMTGILQYRDSTQQKIGNDFRSVVEKLSAKEREIRLASVSSMGTFIKKGIFKSKEKYYDETVDILINRISTELDYNVLNAIISSLERSDNTEYRRIMEKLLAIERNIFVQENVLKDRLRELEISIPKEKDKKRIKLLKEEQEELKMHQQAVSYTISLFLSKVSKSHPEKIEFFRNSLNYVTIKGINLSNSVFDMSALSQSNILKTKFDGSKIEDTVFTFSNLTNSSFANCKEITDSLFDQVNLKDVDFSNSNFRDVFFAGSDLTNTNFTGVKGLHPEYFYKAKNIDKAKFDSEIETKIDGQQVKISADKFKQLTKNMSEEEFKKYIDGCEMPKYRKDDLFTTLAEIRAKELLESLNKNAKGI